MRSKSVLPAIWLFIHAFVTFFIVHISLPMHLSVDVSWNLLLSWTLFNVLAFIWGLCYGSFQTRIEQNIIRTVLIVQVFYFANSVGTIPVLSSVGIAMLAMYLRKVK